MSNQTTTEQNRANDAWECVEKVEEAGKKNKTLKQNYGSWARKLPAMIQTNGLAQAMAFLCAKNKDHHKLLYKHVSEWVLRDDDRHNELIPLILRESSGSYRRRTTEAISYSLWLRRFAEGKDWGSAEGAND